MMATSTTATTTMTTKPSDEIESRPTPVADAVLKPYSMNKAAKFSFLPFLKKEYRFGLDPNRDVCRLFLAGHCPNGNACPDRHTVGTAGLNNLVCKHWLRGLCKKGDACDFLHEYNLRRMPECSFLIRYGYCQNGDDCLYFHPDPENRTSLCPHYENGFCPLGPTCAKKHVRKNICKFYFAGFCPDGRECREGAHPKWNTDLGELTVKVEGERKRYNERDVTDDDMGVKGRRKFQHPDGRDRDGGGGGGGQGGGQGGQGRRRWGKGNYQDREKQN
ncbi:RNA-binding component of cleavage and polyadenylation factor [Orbilia oligospora]|uniref:mRNA 3'-end-processing protein n=2 Tax=Orbilia oligospora TaxID=2813651 RepID=A0A7C8NKN5_ORBOL|nr:RNA-binding component of cleavage and polyadenylation factor [Orbilia oligospora]KAF3093293.1 RNA-binding component of cleavage and polyadenylation factor [Orbilia oligospora]KAF3154979.1 RNA-binding component of cleavage and polyadenylation factor [Orbilia oligospora]